MRLKNSIHQFLSIAILLVVFLFSGSVCGQTSSANSGPSESASVADSLRQLQMQVQQLQLAMQEMKEETGRYRAETLELRLELQATHRKLDTLQAAALPVAFSVSDGPATQEPEKNQSESSSSDSKVMDQRMTRLEEDQQLLSAKVEDQYQTKVESGSKYRVKLSGILLIATHGEPLRIRELEFNRGDLMILAAAALYAGYTLGLFDRPPICSPCLHVTQTPPCKGCNVCMELFTRETVPYTPWCEDSAGSSLKRDPLGVGVGGER